MCSCPRCLTCAASGCDRHMSAEDALAAAAAEGLVLVRSAKNISGFVGVSFRDTSHVHPFYAADYSTASNGRTARKILGFFATGRSSRAREGQARSPHSQAGRKRSRQLCPLPPAEREAARRDVYCTGWRRVASPGLVDLQQR